MQKLSKRSTKNWIRQHGADDSRPWVRDSAELQQKDIKTHNKVSKYYIKNYDDALFSDKSKPEDIPTVLKCSNDVIINQQMYSAEHIKNESKYEYNQDYKVSPMSQTSKYWKPGSYMYNKNTQMLLQQNGNFCEIMICFRS